MGGFRKLLVDLVVPLKRQLAMKAHANVVAKQCQGNCSGTGGNYHTAYKTRAIYWYHPAMTTAGRAVFVPWERFAFAFAAPLFHAKHTLTSRLTMLLRSRLIMMARAVSEMTGLTQCPIRAHARLVWAQARQNSMLYHARPQSLKQQWFTARFAAEKFGAGRQCLFSRLRASTVAPVFTSPRGYVTAAARCTVQPSSKVAFAVGRTFASPFYAINTKNIVPHEHEGARLEQQDRIRMRRHLKRATRPQSSCRLSSASCMRTAPISAAARTSSAPVSVRAEDPETTALLADVAPVAAPQLEKKKHAKSPKRQQQQDTVVVEAELAETLVPVVTIVPAPPPPQLVSVREPTVDRDTLPANSRYCVAFLLPGPSLYDHLQTDAQSSGSVVDDMFMRRFTDLMEMNRHRLDAITRALALLRERINRLEVRIEGHEVRVFMPLGTPVATVRRWLHEAGVVEGDHFLFESTASLRSGGASAFSSRGTSDRSSVSSGSASSAQDIGAFLSRMDELIRDSASLAPQPTKPRRSMADQLEDARAYGASMPVYGY
ncbi:hypothetical protein THASP1DRAFT_24573 [Thamnocephalis sphaerospora]|uniref:Uncharacterized protein n=1 Tax=Thamnocephalis sphaerospora TaxID=78915 RepID=A0A4P9XMS0_9FUNG|nr:hypothetical protein THASP1DRAFT_24573 [Thamnocephalis sphaerospora]|eukprot:RKP07237.1 hypothetical protein THASP1DRAFT_24573 [Thamnocephalis sphaerospora]